MAMGTQITAEQLLDLPNNGKRYELLDGELVEMSPTNKVHARILMTIAYLLQNYVLGGMLGLVAGGDPGVILARNPDRVRAPDICFFARDRMPPDDDVAYYETMPDMVVEIVSPGDRASRVQQKTTEWLEAGVRLVWIVYPETRTVVALQSVKGTDTRIFSEGDTIDGAPVLPGFTAQVAEFFARPA